ncbi:TRAP transporter small permease [Ammoniphilus sp. CFH 90114]|uniref:TRAP transporter small permease n=1 Tax=Ammoniphilus sp. CFH 90114 TaxID=2493665 RepID=UPI00100FCFD8|nr:TRAP transporter small permease [Ammoniphilus sp. CFH 90114]RXT04797.1 TRAP transporter small permease [Ammoniphilus sp. CFH 90114]
MKAILHRISNMLDWVSRRIMITFFAVAFAGTVYQVFSRYVLQSSTLKQWFPTVNFSQFNLPWTEELVRYLFVWIVFLGIGVVYKLKGHAQVEIMKNFLPVRLKRPLSLVVEAVNAVFFTVLLVKGYDMLRITDGQLSPSLQMSMSWMYLSILACSFICLIHALVFFLEGISPNPGEEKSG